MSSRECGPCTACCDGWLTSESMKLKPGTGCTHCVNNGCAIYETRPESPCRKFKCAWLHESSPLPDEMRPDKCGAIVMLDRRFKGIKVITAVSTGQDIPEKTEAWLKKFAQLNNTPLCTTRFPVTDGEYGKGVKTGFGPPSFVSRVKNAIGSDDVVKF